MVGANNGIIRVCIRLLGNCCFVSLHSHMAGQSMSYESVGVDEGDSWLFSGSGSWYKDIAASAW